MRDVLLGALSYVLSIGALVMVMILCYYLFGPPLADRARSFAFSGGGGLLMLATLIVLIAGAIIYDIATR